MRARTITSDQPVNHLCLQVDGKMSKDCYLKALDDCYMRFAAKQEVRAHLQHLFQHTNRV
jgi:3-hydroxy-3-methylglutaryl CoA synthase